MLMGFNTNFLTMGLHHFVPVITPNTKKKPEPINKDTMQREKTHKEIIFISKYNDFHYSGNKRCK